MNKVIPHNMHVRIKAVLETLAVFTLTLVAIALVANSPTARWGNHVLKRPFIEYAFMIVIPLTILVITRRNFTTYGIAFKNIKYHLDVAFTCFIPYAAIRGLLFLIKVDYIPLDRLLSVGSSIGYLFLFAWILRKKPNLGSVTIVGALLFFMAGCPHSAASISIKAISALIFYTFFLGPGEEILFRGYIQSRLNESFGRPYRFFGVAWGWGLVIASVLFGLMHFLNLPSLFEGQLDLRWWALVSNFFWALPIGFIREKTGSIIAPAILHGLPQGIAWALLSR